MKKSTMEALHAYLYNHDDSIDLNALTNEIHAEWERTMAKAQANKDIYAAAHDVLIEALTNTPQTSTEIFESNEWPKDFTQGKLNYALRAMWADEITKIDNGKKPNTYTRKGA